LLSRILGGHTEDLEPVQPPPVEPLDVALDPAQREAVALALGTPDVCLIQGLPGTGKSRVVSEIVTQAAARGQRVLLLGRTPQAVDVVLERIGTRESVLALRLLEPNEPPDALPASVRALAQPERARWLAERVSQQTHEAILSAEHHRRALQDALAAREPLAELASHWEQLAEQGATLQRRRDGLWDEVESEAQSARCGERTATPFANQAAASHAAHQAARDALAARIGAQQAQIDMSRERIYVLRTELEQCGPTADPGPSIGSKLVAWLKTVAHPGRVAHVHELRRELEELESKITSQESEADALRAEQARADAAYAKEQLRISDEEVTRRRTLLDDQIAALRKEQGLLEEKWQQRLRELQPGLQRLSQISPGAVEEASRSWAQDYQRTEEAVAFGREWAAYVEANLHSLADRLHAFVNVVAGTTAGFARDARWNEPTANGSEVTPAFDLLVLEEADQITESEFQRLARRARRWVLIGEPVPEPLQSSAVGLLAASAGRRDVARRALGPRAARPADLRPGFFQRLWQQLHLGPIWVQEADELCCRLRPLSPGQRQLLERERVADCPDVELRILTPSHGKPMLAEVGFPPRMTISQAKQYLYQQLEQLPVRALGTEWSWVEEPDRVILRLADHQASQETAVLLEPGVSAMVCGPGLTPNGVSSGPLRWETCCVVFDRAAGWHRERALAWARERLEVRDLGRTAVLEVPHRMAPALAPLVANFFPGEGYRLPGGRVAGRGNAVEFVAVPPEEVDRRRPRGERPRGGAGLELDLSDPRHRERLPKEVREGLPDGGFVNYLEAQAVVRALAALLQDAHVRQPESGPAVLVLALYPAQAELIRRLAAAESSLAAAAARYEIAAPADCRQREAPVVLVSLTRSHTHRAVSYGEGPQAFLLALTRARERLILFGDPGTLARRSHWEGAVEHLDEPAARCERDLVVRLLRWLLGQGTSAPASEGGGA
jgi:hypothetical protein